ncbi:bifunctional methylenetetrahydrofolate dehydrogenase/methenyltetrahydrofolate cyclohydrolase FolD [Gehongia tenuis]|uniref:Bifunctional protein FolD n=1 Tax=Gehongia tenuis TaxID=2763655 RepID=A0A926HKM9_9FIRM|nr:bifunctional methylenetetrahydrofolate dehydrogenase/methenyltetrahydrofolate cyclohydrolase FolD [Gehongia tenuis]MBC8531167.1 bifunctional methylenetetrahydrofolate dehydrogenase/methenyltetrahydrofolate cyclohydrolase FolD [Gehongia tenuis]
MSAQIIDGKKVSKDVREELKAKCEDLKAKGVEPCLAVVLVGDDPGSQVYVRNKERGCAEVGIKSIAYRLDAGITQQTLLELVDKLNRDPAVHGILVQLPLPKHLDEKEVLRLIDPKKDVDGFHVVNAGSLFTGEGGGFVSCTPQGIMRLIASTGVSIEGKNAVVIGRSNIVGKPMAMLLLNANATVTVCHSRTKNLKEIAKGADILVVAIGRPEFVTGDMIKSGAVVIDVGMNRVDGKLKGDVKFDEAKEVAGYVTPVPGGVGPTTITMLLSNTLQAAEAQG